MHTYDSLEDELDSKLKGFKAGRIGAMNQPIHLENGLIVMLENWVHTDDTLTITIALPRLATQPEEEGQEIRSLGNPFVEVADAVDDLLEENGYESPDNYRYEPDAEARHGQSKFIGTIPCPR